MVEVDKPIVKWMFSKIIMAWQSEKVWMMLTKWQSLSRHHFIMLSQVSVIHNISVALLERTVGVGIRDSTTCKQATGIPECIVKLIGPNF